MIRILYNKLRITLCLIEWCFQYTQVCFSSKLEVDPVGKLLLPHIDHFLNQFDLIHNTNAFAIVQLCNWEQNQ